MRLTKLLLLVLLAGAARLSAQEPAPAGAQEPVPSRPGLVLTPERLLRSDVPQLRLGLAPLPSSFRLPIPAWAPRAEAGRWGPPGAAVPPSLAGLPPGAGLAAVPPAADTAGLPEDTAGRGGVFHGLELPAVVQEAADLALRVEGRGELGGAWNRYRPCEAGLRLNCNPGTLPQLQPEIQFGVQVDGTITDRIHVDVDYDQRREFDAANNLNVYYQGAPGELLQRIEMGDVSIDLPASRYLTQGIPAGNFGFKAGARLAGLDVEALWAQQNGDIASREFRLGGAGQSGLVQDQERILDDADYASGQFFFLVDPERLVGWPHVDVLTLDRGAAPASLRPAADRLVLYRDEGVVAGRYTDQAQTGKFLADAVTAGGELSHSGLFRVLEPGRDYYLHSSGLWIALRAPLRDDEALAVGYVSETGVAVGDPAPESRPPGETPELRLVRGPVTIHQPGQPTWPWEMHQVYRLDSSAEVDPATLELVVSLGHAAGGATFKEFGGRRIPLLRLFGVDDDAPADRIDAAHVFRPGAELDAIGPTPLRGTFIVFPTLEPFGEPPPVPSEGLSAVETEAILGGDANPEIYDEPDPVIRAAATRFRLNFRYRVRLEGLLSSFNLGAFGIRDGSERITVDDRLLVRNVDYVIDYDLGLVTLLDPAATLGTNPDAEIRASWEQKAIFDIAPTTVVGLNARADVGPYGQVNFVGLYQAEQSIVRRPQLGLEPGAVLLGGASGDLAFRADWLARTLAALPLVRADSTARVDIAGEVALSAPEPNRRGDTYLDDFEATDEIPLSLDAFEWDLGSAPADATGVPELPVPLTPDNAASLVWQDRYLENGEEVGFLRSDDIDREIAFAGARLAERVLYLTLDGDERTVPAPQWRSLTTVVSTTGRDLSRSEYLEFYAAPLANPVGDAVLVIDIGRVSEDAFYFDDEGSLEGTRFGQPWGRGVLDEEAALALRDVWGPDDDAQGLWDQRCEADRIKPVPLGDPRANCTVLNGRPDTEDLDGNGVLDDTDGPSFRYVVPLDLSSPYIVRDRGQTQTQFRLFRIPLRGPGAIPLNGATEASWRFVKHIRMTVVKPSAGPGTLALARLRIAGSRWTKRDVHGVAAGLTSDQPGTGAVSTNVRVGPVSRLTDGAAYASPPGVEEELQDPGAAIGQGGVEFNEKSLRLSWEGLPGDERAEVYFRYPQQPRSFLEYRQIRFWAVPRSGTWGPDGEHRLLVKLGTDPRNYYLYQTRLRPAAAGDAVAPTDWFPERVIDFEEWLALKAEAEVRLASGQAQGPLTVWSADSTYGVVLEDRARAPNLASVRELTFAVYNGGAVDSDGEVWIDDMRLGAGAGDAGLAGRIHVDLEAGGFLAAAVSFGGRGGRFRQLDGAPSYLSEDELTVNTTAQLGRLAPEAWGLSAPLTLSYGRSSLDPIFLQGTDVRAERLRGLRSTGSSRRRVGMTVRKTTPSSNPVVSALVDGTALRVGYTSFRDGTVTTSSRLDALDGGVEIDRSVGNVDVDIVPGFVEGLLRLLVPGPVEESAWFERLAGTRLRLTPERIGLSASYASQDARVWRYDQVLETPADDDVTAIESPRRTLEGGARIALRPFESLTARVGVVSGRDVLDPEEATTIAEQRQALLRARQEVAGIPVGWERDRVLTTDAAYRPVLADWLRPSLTWTTRFGQRRDPSHLELVGAPDGAVTELQRTFHVDRRFGRGLVFDPAALLRPALAGVGPLRAVTDAIKPFELSWTDQAGSRFDRELTVPGLDYQLGLSTLESVTLLQDDTAATALRRDGFRARSGVRIGPSASLDVGFTENDARVYDRRAGPRAQLERSWPDVQASWDDVPVPGWLAAAFDHWSLSTGYIRTERVTALKGAVPRIWSQLERTVPAEVRVGFVGGLSLAYAASVTAGDGLDPTGTTRLDAVTHGVDLSGRFRAPFGLRERAFPEPVRLSLAYDYQSQRQCRVAGNRGPTAECTPFIDHVNRRLNFSLSTLISQLDVGVQVGYVDRRNFVGTQVGSSQLQVGLFGQFNVQAGTFNGAP